MKSTGHCKSCAPQGLLRPVIDAALRRVPKISGMKFLPWVGENYGRSKLFGHNRLLIIGASHYEWCRKCWDEHIERGPDTTCRCVVDGYQEGGIQHFRNIEYAFLNQRCEPAGREAFWQSIAYYNFVQRMVGHWSGGGRAAAPTPEMWREGRDLFPKVIRTLKPDFVVVLGRTVWEQMPEQESGTLLSSITKSERTIEACIYKVGRKVVLAGVVRHPARGLGKPWHPVLTQFLNSPVVIKYSS